MESTKDIGIVLMKLNDTYYRKGISKIPISIKGIRKDKIATATRKIVVPQLLKAKDSNKLLKIFIHNLEDEFENLSKQDWIKKIIETPNKNQELLHDKDLALAYLYFLSLNDKKYKEVLEYLIDQLQNEVNIKQIPNELQQEKSNQQVKELLEVLSQYEKEIKELKEISRQRKEKIRSLEMRYEIKNEENEKNIANYQDILKKNEELEKKLSEIKMIDNHMENQNREEKQIENRCKIAVLGIEKKHINTQYIEYYAMSVDELLCNDNDVFEKIFVYNEKVHISKRRRIRKKYCEKVKFYDSIQELEKELKLMEEQYEN